MHPEIRRFVQRSTGNYGKVKLVLQKGRYLVESPFPEVLRKLLKVTGFACHTVASVLYYCYTARFKLCTDGRVAMRSAPMYSTVNTQCAR